MHRSIFLACRVFIISVLLPTFSFTQSLEIFDIDASNFPLLRAKVYAYDAEGKQMGEIPFGDLQLWENGVSRTVTHISCPPMSQPEAISSVLTIDISGSMIGERLEAAKAAARTWVEALPLGRSECAITTFDNRSYVNRDFTTDRTALLETIASLSALGLTNYDAALLTPPAGALEVSKSARNRSVVVFLSDGLPNEAPKQDDIIAEALRQNTSIHAVILGMSAPQSIENICSATGGMCFDNITTMEETEAAFRHILHIAQGGSACVLEWLSSGCDVLRTLEAALPAVDTRTSVTYSVPRSALPRLVFNPSTSLRFGEVEPGTRTQLQVSMTALGGAVHIEGITTSNPLFRIIDYDGTAPPFTLNVGDERILTVDYSPEDSNYVFGRFDVQGNACEGTALYADGGWTRMRSPFVSIRVLRPNGGERFVAGSEEELYWDGVMPEEKVRLDYSTDGGASWRTISTVASGLRHTWRVPKFSSDICLLRVTARARPFFGEDMVLIPAGSFHMGNITGHPNGLSNEQPVHEVNITRPFLMSRTLVTQELYEEVMGSNPAHFIGTHHPVDQVSWYDAVAFCNMRSLLEGLDPCYTGEGEFIVCDFSANGYRLPTEAEWEYACRAGTETDFHTGNMTHSAFSPLDPALDRAGWYGGNSNATTYPVALKQANAFELYDMHGSVWEWCCDWWDSDYYAVSPAVDPRGPDTGRNRVLRGGSWNGFANYCRSAFRGGSNPGVGGVNYGFRVVRRYDN